MLKKVTIDKIRENDQPNFVKTQAIEYSREQDNGIWEMILSKDSVHILVDSVDTKELLLVKQVRVPVLVKNPEGNGECFECCAGLIDKDLPIVQIAKEEILEELGYEVPIDRLIPVKNYKSSVGTQGTNVYTFNCIVRAEDKVSEGGGLDSEDIEIVRIKHHKVMEFIKSTDNIDATTLFLLINWLYGKKE